MASWLGNATGVQKQEADRLNNAKQHFEEFLSKWPKVGTYTISQVIDTEFKDSPLKDTLHDCIDPLGKLLEASGHMERIGSHLYKWKQQPPTGGNTYYDQSVNISGGMKGDLAAHSSSITKENKPPRKQATNTAAKILKAILIAAIGGVLTWLIIGGIQSWVASNP